MEEITSEFDMEVKEMSLIPVAPKDLFLLLPDPRTVERVYNQGQPFHGPNFSLHTKRWTRLALAQGVALPILVDIELRGIPAHAWEKSTAQQLLNNVC